jgi:2-polyprenyl-6-methoxyphenol hydroxylase-like FAD-dependent oxidoreductase
MAESWNPTRGPAQAGLIAGDPAGEVTLAWTVAQDLTALYQLDDPEQARARAEQLIADLRSCPITELARLGRTLHTWRAELCAHFDHPTCRTARPRSSAVAPLRSQRDQPGLGQLLEVVTDGRLRQAQGPVRSQVHSSPFSLTSSSDTRRSLAGSASALSRIESWAPSSTDSGANVSGILDSWAVGTAPTPRRIVLDAILVKAAVEAGAELWDGCTVDELLTDDDTDTDTGPGSRVRGIRGHLRNGRTVSARATIVVGADGMRSPVAAQLGAPTYWERPARQGTYFTYWSGLPNRINTLYARPYRSVVTIPTNDDLTLVAVNWIIDDYRAVRHDIEGHYHQTIAEAAPELAEQLRGGRREDRWIGAAVPGRFRRPYGPGWALVGNAGYLKDPCTAQGITDAFHHAELLTDALDDGLRRRQSFHEALAAHEQQRNAAAIPMYEFTYATSALEPPTPRSRSCSTPCATTQPSPGASSASSPEQCPSRNFFASLTPAA